jgi:HAD superfamily hydrolase (TIGR01450 family)
LAVPTHTNISSLIERYDALFFDSYGVLIDGVDAVPGAFDLVHRMNTEEVNYFIVTNDASASLAARIDKFRVQGFDIPVERIVNSGSLIAGFFEQHDLKQSPTLALGTEDARDYTRSAGGMLVEIDDNLEPDVVVIGHSGPHDWELTLESLLSLFSRRFTERNPVRLILPNPDFIYPNGPGVYGFGAAAFVDLLEQALVRLHGPHESLVASKLGKPYSPIFNEAVRRAGTSDAVMIGDQLETDIRGANSAGIDSAVVTTGINRRIEPEEFEEVADEQTPRYILASLV